MTEKIREFLQSPVFSSFRNRFLFMLLLCGVSAAGFCLLFSFLPFFAAFVLALLIAGGLFFLSGMRTGSGRAALNITLATAVYAWMLIGLLKEIRDSQSLVSVQISSLKGPYTAPKERFDYLKFPKEKADLQRCVEEKYTSTGGSAKQPHKTVSVYTLCPVQGTAEFAFFCHGFEEFFEDRFPCRKLWEGTLEAAYLADKDIRIQRMLALIETKHGVKFSENIQILKPVDEMEFSRKIKYTGWKIFFLTAFCIGAIWILSKYKRILTKN